MAEKLLMLALSPTMETGVIAKWNKREGDRIGPGDILCEVETDKATMDYESPSKGVLLKIILPEGSKASIGDPIAILGKEGEDISSLLPKSTYIRSSPLARKIALMNGLELENIRGSGPAGRIIKRDIEAALKQPLIQSAAGTGLSFQAGPSSQDGQTGLDEVIPLSGKRKIIAQRLSESKFTAPHYYLKVTAATDNIMGARSKLNAHGGKVSMNAFLIKFTAEALKKHPAVNSTWAGESIIKHGRIDIGLAVAQKDGLITPVVRDCGSKGILSIDSELKVLIQKAQENALKPDEYTGATFTVSNLGSYGIEEFTAIINPPGSAILAVGKIIKEQVVEEDDTVNIKSNMKLTLSCDHRVIDGAVGAAFLVELKNMLEDPIRVLY